MISLEPAACVIVVVDVQSESWSLAAKLLIVMSVFLYFSFFFLAACSIKVDHPQMSTGFREKFKTLIAVLSPHPAPQSLWINNLSSR